MRACIHRGAREIGGSCVEVEHAGARILLDLGLPLDASEQAGLPPVAGLDGVGAPPLAVLVSHGHPDHHGLVPTLVRPVPLFIGQAAYQLLDQARFFTGAPALPLPAGFLEDGKAFEVGPFRVTPYLADHSAYDAYSLLIEAGERRLFYTGDLRAHGRKPGAFQRLLDAPPRPLHALLLEGTQIGRDQRESLSEDQLELALAEAMKNTAGAVLACYSGQNIDRLVTVFRAAKRAGRTLVLDLYTALLARATGRATIPQAEWEGVRVFLPHSQRARVIRQQVFELTDSVRAKRIYPEELQAKAPELVISFRASMIGDLERANCLGDARLIWSLWPGYLEPGDAIDRFATRHQIRVAVLHSSGHAAVADLERLAAALAAERVVPIHTAAPERFREHFERAEPHEDGTWWEV